MYLRLTKFFIFVFDVRNYDTFQNKDIFVELVSSKLLYQDDVSRFLIFNLIYPDLPQVVSQSEARQKAESLVAKYFEVNCRTKEGFDELFQAVVSDFFEIQESQD